MSSAPTRGQAVRRMRRDLDLTQADLAARAGLRIGGGGFISRLENDHLERVEDALRTAQAEREAESA